MSHKLEAELGQTTTVEVKVDLPDSADARWWRRAVLSGTGGAFRHRFDPIRSNPAPTRTWFLRGVTLLWPGWMASLSMCVLKRKNPTTGEIKRMWTASSAAGGGGTQNSFIR